LIKIDKGLAGLLQTAHSLICRNESNGKTKKSSSQKITLPSTAATSHQLGVINELSGQTNFRVISPGKQSENNGNQFDY